MCIRDRVNGAIGVRGHGLIVAGDQIYKLISRNDDEIQTEDVANLFVVGMFCELKPVLIRG